MTAENKEKQSKIVPDLGHLHRRLKFVQISETGRVLIGNKLPNIRNTLR
jgi:hypothetical protein